MKDPTWITYILASLSCLVDMRMRAKSKSPGEEGTLINSCPSILTRKAT